MAENLVPEGTLPLAHQPMNCFKGSQGHFVRSRSCFPGYENGVYEGLYELTMVALMTVRVSQEYMCKW